MKFACLNPDFHLFAYLGLTKFEIMPKILHYFSMNILGNFIGSPSLLSKWGLIQWTQALLKLCDFLVSSLSQLEIKWELFTSKTLHFTLLSVKRSPNDP